MKRIVAIACLALIAVVPAARAQGGPDGGIFRGIRNRIAGRAPEQVWAEASVIPSAAEALPIMEGLARRSGEPEIALKAALWVGHYRYGTGQTEAALEAFAQAAEIRGEPRDAAEAVFWAAQCRNLLGRPQDPIDPEPDRGVDGVLAAIVQHDGELRTGRVETALHGYLSLEGAARRAGCLAPLLYRVGLVASTSAGRRGRASIDWDLIHSWEPTAFASPERALVAALEPGQASEPAPGNPASAQPGNGDGSSASSSSAGPAGVPAGSPAGMEPAASGGAGSEEPGPGAAAGGSEDGGGGSEDGGAAAAGVDKSGDAADTGPADAYAVQLGAFRNQDGARRELDRLAALGLPVRIDVVDDEDAPYRIRLGHEASKKGAAALGERLCRGVNWRVVRIEP